MADTFQDVHPSTRICAWSGKPFEGKAYILQTTEGPEIVSPESLFGGEVPGWHVDNLVAVKQAAEQAAAQAEADARAEAERQERKDAAREALLAARGARRDNPEVGA